MAIKLYEKLNNGEVYFIAEMSANHAGKYENAIEIVRAAAAAGADCLKIQTYTADTITLDCDNEYFTITEGLWKGYNRYQLYKEAYTPWEWQAGIKAECEKLGLDFLSTPFDKTAVDFLEQLDVEFYKIASFEIVDIPLIKYVASKGKPIIMSCGLASPDEISEAIACINSQGNNQIILLKCCSDYPAQYADMNLETIADMRNQFKYPTGLSDHSMGHIADVTAVALGASVIEKHFCLSRELKSADSEFSMEPGEFKDMVDQVNLAKKAMGKVSYARSDREENSAKNRKSIFVKKDINIGECFTEENICVVRPADGLHPRYYENTLGKCAARALKRGEPLRLEDIK